MALSNGFNHHCRMIPLCNWVLMFSILISPASLQDATLKLSSILPVLPTVTVRGFLNFKTTVDGTVLVFTSASADSSMKYVPRVTSSEIYHGSVFTTDALLQDDTPNSREGIQYIAHTTSQNSIGLHKTQASDLEHLENNVNEPFLHQISDNAVLPPTGPVNNDLDKITKKISSPGNQYPTGLVTILGGTQIDGTSTTVFETNVIGTYIDGKYAQILQSTSHVISPISILPYSSEHRLKSNQNDNNILETPPIINPASQSFTTGVSEMVKLEKIALSQEETPGKRNVDFVAFVGEDMSESRQTEHVSLTAAGSPERRLMVNPEELERRKIKFVSSPRETVSAPDLNSQTWITERDLSTAIITRINPSTINSRTDKATASQNAASGIIPPSTSVEETGAPVNLLKENKLNYFSIESSFQTPDATLKLKSDKPTESLESVRSSKFLTALPSLATVVRTVIRQPHDDSTLAASNKNWRNSTSRIRYLSPRRPSQSVRLNRFKVKLTVRQGSADEPNIPMTVEEEELEEEQTSKEDEEIDLAIENLGIATEPAKLVFHETTITSEVTLHVGRRKSIRTLTITTSVPLTVHPTDIAALLQSSESPEMFDDATSDIPYHHIVTRTFTTTERALQTSIVPVYDGRSTTFHTVTESFFIMKIITAYRTLPFSDASVLESIFDEQKETENMPTTLDVAANVQASVTESALLKQDKSLAIEETDQPLTALPTATNAANPLLSLGHALSNNPLAAVYLGLHQLNAHMTLYSTVTDTTSYITTDTIYSTKTIRFYDGRSTRFRMISDPVATKRRTLTNTVTSVKPYLNTQVLRQQQQLQKLIAATQIPGPQQQFNTVTTTFTSVSTTTSLSTRIYTLIYNGYSTKFRTVTSTNQHPITVTVITTTKIPIAPTKINIPIGYPYTT